jgi:hypothetical protein
MTGDAWRSIKPTSARGRHAELGNWGSDSRGWWLFLGPISRTTDQGAWYHVQLDFVRGEKAGELLPDRLLPPSVGWCDSEGRCDRG